MSIFNKRRFSFRKKGKDGKPTDEIEDDSSNDEEETHAAESPNSPNKSKADADFLPPPYEGSMPTFFYIGGWAKECLKKGYKIGCWHFDCTTEANDHCTLCSFGTGKPDFNTVSCGVGIRETFGIFRMSQVWQNDGILGTLGVRAEAAGAILNAMLRATYASHSRHGVKLELHSGYERPPIKLEVIIPILKEPKLLGYILVQPAEKYLLAYRTVYDCDNKGFDKHAFCLGYNNGRTELGLKFENFKDLRGSIFQRIGDRWAVALKANMFKDEARQIAIGGQYQIDDNALIKAKIRDDGIFGMVFQHQLSDNIQVMYHAGFDVHAPVKGEHKLGVSWSLNG